MHTLKLSSRATTHKACIVNMISDNNQATNVMHSSQSRASVAVTFDPMVYVRVIPNIKNYSENLKLVLWFSREELLYIRWTHMVEKRQNSQRLGNNSTEVQKHQEHHDCLRQAVEPVHQVRLSPVDAASSTPRTVPITKQKTSISRRLSNIFRKAQKNHDCKRGIIDKPSRGVVNKYRCTSTTVTTPPRANLNPKRSSFKLERF